MELREVRVSENLKDYFDNQSNLVAIAWGDFANDQVQFASLPNVWQQDSCTQWTEDLQYLRKRALEDFAHA